MIMKTLLTLTIIALLCGCRHEPVMESTQPKPSLSAKSQYDREMDDTVMKERIEIAFLAGWDSGFGICKDIKEGRLTNMESAMARTFQERTNYLGTNRP